MTFRQLEVFLAVVRLGTVSMAAESLGITQSGASRMISDLEGNVGFPLFHRAGRGLEITQQGRSFHQQVERYFDGMDALNDAVRLIRSGIMRIIRIACLPTLSTAILPGAIKALRDEFPDMAVEIETVDYAAGLSLLKNRRVDVMISFLMDEIDGVTVSNLVETRCVLAAREDHPLAAQEVVTAEDLLGVELLGQIPSQVLVPGQNKTANLRDDLFAKNSKHIWCHTSSTRYALVATGSAVSIAEPFASPLFRSQGVIVRKFEPKMPLHYGFAALSDILDSPEVALFQTALRNEFKAFSEREQIEMTVFDK